MSVETSQQALREAKAKQDQEHAPAQTDNGQNQTSDKPRFSQGRSLAWYAKQAIDDEKTLLGDRYLCRGGGAFIIAPSGMGKSTMSLQLAILWCCGLAAFGIKPAKALRILIIQSEDDEGDCTEMSRMVEHLNLTDKQKELVDQNTELIRCNELVGGRFIEALRNRLEEAKQMGRPFDLVIANPYGVYLGTDVKDTDACTKFLNQWLNPLLTLYQIGIILIHHTAKTNFQNTDKYSIWDWSYHGAGASCITNWARVIIAIKPEAEDFSIFRFIAAKRGKRIGDQWEGGFERFFAWSQTPGVLRWEEATADQIAKATASKNHHKEADLEEALKVVPLLDAELTEKVIYKIKVACDVGEKKARTALKELIKNGKVFNVKIPNPGSRSFAGVSRTCQTSL
jgi:RecA-family ATPase